MLILEDLSAEVPDTNAHHWHLDKLSHDNTNCALLYGYNACLNPRLLHKTQSHKRLLFNNWAPCEFAQEFTHPNQHPLEYEKAINIVYSIDPYSVDWLNTLSLGRTYENIFYPFCSGYVPQPTDKQFDVIYHGGIHGIEHAKMLREMIRHKYCYCSMTHSINPLTIQHLGWATHKDLSFREKINLVAQSKISVCYNLVHVMPDQVPRIQKLMKEHKPQNQAFETVGTWNVMPQFKTRMHEAAFSRSLNLIRRDNWNVTERYYTPDKEFIYFNDEADLRVKLAELLAEWDSSHVQGIIEAAYARSMEYTTEKFTQTIEAREAARL